MARQLTITLDDDVAEKLDAEARRKGAPLSQVVNEHLRQHDSETSQPRRPFRVRAKDLGAVPGVNFDCAWSLLDDGEGAHLK
jgi:hypothetical protein